MENKINVAELLKYCEKGMELDCILFKDTPAYLHAVTTDTNYPIEIKVEYPSKELEIFFLNKYGAIYNRPTAKCVIFPKGKTTWEGFVPPRKFKDGDIVATLPGDWIGITTGGESSEFIPTYCVITGDGAFEVYLNKKETWKFHRLATEEEKQKLFQAIKDNGYYWNAETKTLEKLIQPKFKVGDRIKAKDDYKKSITGGHVSTITSIKDGKYWSGIFAIEYINEQDKWELDKFDITTLKPFDSKVLVRHNKDNKWCASFFSHIDKDLHSNCYKFVTIAGKSYPMMIPYEANEHLRGTTNDCDEYYKTWE